MRTRPVKRRGRHLPPKIEGPIVPTWETYRTTYGARVGLWQRLVIAWKVVLMAGSEGPARAWLHIGCGTLNVGGFGERSSDGEPITSCTGCRFEVKNPDAEIYVYALLRQPLASQFRDKDPSKTGPEYGWRAAEDGGDNGG